MRHFIHHPRGKHKAELRRGLLPVGPFLLLRMLKRGCGGEGFCLLSRVGWRGEISPGQRAYTSPSVFLFTKADS